MRSRLVGHAPAHPVLLDFPERADLPHLSDQEAEAALALLRSLVEQDRASVYTRASTPEGARPRWSVWDTTSGTGRRLELEPWALGVLPPRAGAGTDAKRPTAGTG
jgi:hypothetical protein